MRHALAPCLVLVAALDGAPAAAATPDRARPSARASVVASPPSAERRRGAEQPAVGAEGSSGDRPSATAQPSSRSRAATARGDARPLPPSALLGLSWLADSDHRGLGSEAGRARDWTAGRRELRLSGPAGGWRLVDEAGETLALSAELGRALESQRAFFVALGAAKSRPVRHRELREAVLSTRGVERIRELFERVLAERVRLGDDVLFLELGGLATLDDGHLHLAACPDPTRPALREIARTQGDPAAIARLFREQPEVLSLLDERGQLEAELGLLEQRERRGVPRARREEAFRRAVLTVLRNAADSILLAPASQLGCIADGDWSGRWVGPWHLHPPTLAPGGWLPGDRPSPDDLRIAATNGQFLTIVFRSDGFDVHDLSGVASLSAPEPSGVRTVRHRSPAWRAHFAKLRERLAE